MLRTLLSRQIDAVERRWNYDAGYMRELLAAGPWRFIRYGLVASLGHGKAPPKAAVSAATILATLAEDCGPCTQIGVDLALADGMAPEMVRAILAGDETAMGETAALGYRFARAVLEKDLPAADKAREAIAARWGQAAVVDLALAVTTGRMYPTLKFGLGHARTCAGVTVAGASAPFHRPESLAA